MVKFTERVLDSTIGGGCIVHWVGNCYVSTNDENKVIKRLNSLSFPKVIAFCLTVNAKF
jgi:hypothetical protein